MYIKLRQILFVCLVVLGSVALSQTSVLAMEGSQDTMEEGHSQGIKKKQMMTFEPLDPRVPITKQLEITNQLEENVSPVVLINVFKVDSDDADELLKAWEHDANWMKMQPGYISTQLHRGIAGSSVFLNYAVWESVKHFQSAFTHPEFRSRLSAYPSSTIAQPHLFSRVAVSNLCTK